jgi:hypothetical protein
LWFRQLNSGVGPASGRPSQALADQIFFSKPTLPLFVLTPLPLASAHRRAAEGFIKLSKRSLGQQGRPSRGTPTPPGYGYLTRHLCTRQLTLGEAVQIADRRVLVLEMRKKHGSMPKKHTCSGPDNRNEQNTGTQGAITNETPFPPPQVRTTPHDWGACGATEGRRMARRHLLQQQRRRRLLLRGAEQQQR